MKILVDEMPNISAACLFSEWDLKTNKGFKCRIIGFVVPDDCPKECPYLAKGAVERELVFEAEGETEIGKAVLGNWKTICRTRSIS